MKLKLLIILALILVSCQQGPKACFEERCFSVEVVDTPETRQTGLMHRENLPEPKGMLFIFENIGRYPFWMKNTLIPLDMIWIDWDYNVVHIKEYAVPCETSQCPSYDPGVDSKYVLEINGGLARETGIEVGDKVSLNY